MYLSVKYNRPNSNIGLHSIYFGEQKRKLDKEILAMFSMYLCVKNNIDQIVT
jgi:hypothetical protein